LNDEYTTSTNLFDAEMKYLHDNGFTVLTMANLVYDDSSNYISDSNGGAHETISNNQKEFAARVTDPERENDNLSTAEEPELSNEVSEEDTASKMNPPAIKSDGDDTISDGDTGQIPSGIMRFGFEP
jgi:hypothetical protein